MTFLTRLIYYYTSPESKHAPARNELRVQAKRDDVTSGNILFPFCIAARIADKNR